MTTSPAAAIISHVRSTQNALVLPLVPKPARDVPTNIHHPPSPASDDGFDEYMARSQGHRDPWRRKLHAQDRERERTSEASRKERECRKEEAKVREDMARYDKMYHNVMSREDSSQMADAGGCEDGLVKGGQDMENGGSRNTDGVLSNGM